MWTGGEPASVVGMTFRAGLVANEHCSVDGRRGEHLSALGGGTGGENRRYNAHDSHQPKRKKNSPVATKKRGCNVLGHSEDSKNRSEVFKEFSRCIAPASA